MSILKSKASRSTSADASLAAVLPLAAILPALAVLFGDRIGGLASGALVVLGLVLVARAGALVAAGAAEREDRDEAVLDGLEPLHGLHR
ncbi:hypothetical protein [Streptomyces sp. NPDC058157]|uniref:hypothetical protein n=1 Tax=Streptomyces sp. NPDC058157 TaxID=3346360 RepID=UPI0036E40EA1